MVETLQERMLKARREALAKQETVKQTQTLIEPEPERKQPSVTVIEEVTSVTPKPKRERKPKIVSEEIEDDVLSETGPLETTLSDLAYVSQEGTLTAVGVAKLRVLSKKYKSQGQHIVRFDKFNPYLRDLSAELAQLARLVALIQQRETFEQLVHERVLSNTKYPVQKKIR